MRTQLLFRDPFNRDISWITQEVIEEYAGALLRSPLAAEYCLQKWTQNDLLKTNCFNELVAVHPDLPVLQEELIEEFGEERFIGKAKTKEYHIRQLEIAIEFARSPDDKAKLYKELREYRGWTAKPAEKGTTVNVTNMPTGDVKLDAANPREAERIVMSIFGSIG